MNPNHELQQKQPNNRGEKKTNPSNKKFDFKIYKKNTITSLNEVEHFLNNFNKFSNYIKLYKILK